MLNGETVMEQKTNVTINVTGSNQLRLVLGWGGASLAEHREDPHDPHSEDTCSRSYCESLD